MHPADRRKSVAQACGPCIDRLFSPGSSCREADGDNDGIRGARDAGLSSNCATNARFPCIARSDFFSTEPVVGLDRDGMASALDAGKLRLELAPAPGSRGVANVCAS